MAQMVAGLFGELRAQWRMTDEPGQVYYYRSRAAMPSWDDDPPAGAAVVSRPYPLRPSPGVARDLREVYPASGPDELVSHPLALEDLM